MSDLLPKSETLETPADRPATDVLARLPGSVGGSPSEGGTAAEESRADGGDNSRQRRFLLFAALPSWLISMLVHIVLLVCLALYSLPPILENHPNDLTLGTAEQTELLDAPIMDAPADRPSDTPTESSQLTDSPVEQISPSELVSTDALTFDAHDLTAAPLTATDLNPLGPAIGPKSDLLQQIGALGGEGLEGRGMAARSRLLREGGGNEASEKSVQLALKWFQRHQNPDGSWSFQPLGGRCDCGEPGSLAQAFNGATAMALLPFLGAGNTHREGQYQNEVRAGIYYLINHQRPNGSFEDPGGNLYSHGLCAIALSEAYAMTQDQALMRPAQAALNFTAFAQDRVGGGWRYVPHEPGDTSAVGWQLMALKSGRMAYLQVDPSVFVGATRFLDSVQTDAGAAYGYKDPGDRLSTSAIGLLCRMYLGWTHEEPALRRGVERVSQSGPSKVDMYYNYYATQVLRHYEGPLWEKWNKEMRDFLVSNQATKGHESGSWFMGNAHPSKTGGRLYNTSMATMILEVYYRHLPLYRKQATDDDFEL